MYLNYIKNLLQIEEVIVKKLSHGLFNTTFIMYTCHQLRETVSYTHVAKQANVSIFTAIRTFNRINYPKPSKLPEVLCIDEFRGNAETDKFQCILVNGAKDRHVCNGV